MFKLGMKGSIGVIIGSVAIMLILFAVTATNNISEQNQTFLNIQVAKETALGTENIIRLLDKATSRIIWQKSDPASACAFAASSDDFTTEYTRVINEFVSLSSSPINCSVINTSLVEPMNIIVTGTLECSIELNDFRAEDTRNFSFRKNIVDVTDPVDGSTTCLVFDNVSGCQEQPNFNC